MDVVRGLVSLIRMKMKTIEARAIKEPRAQR